MRDVRLLRCRGEMCEKSGCGELVLRRSSVLEVSDATWGRCIISLHICTQVRWTSSPCENTVELSTPLAQSSNDTLYP